MGFKSKSLLYVNILLLDVYIGFFLLGIDVIKCHIYMKDLVINICSRSCHEPCHTSNNLWKNVYNQTSLKRWKRSHNNMLKSATLQLISRPSSLLTGRPKDRVIVHIYTSILWSLVETILRSSL